MLLPVKAHYAAVAMLELALKYQDPVPVSLRGIADEHEIPLPFLTQILQQLRGAQLVSSTRGALGGYRLCRSPSKINMAEIVQAVCPMATSSPHPSSNTRANRSIAAIWDSLDVTIQKQLSDISLSELVEQHQQLPDSMFYI